MISKLATQSIHALTHWLCKQLHRLTATFTTFGALLAERDVWRWSDISSDLARGLREDWAVWLCNGLSFTRWSWSLFTCSIKMALGGLGTELSCCCVFKVHMPPLTGQTGRVDLFLLERHSMSYWHRKENRRARLNIGTANCEKYPLWIN